MCQSMAQRSPLQSLEASRWVSLAKKETCLHCHSHFKAGRPFSRSRVSRFHTILLRMFKQLPFWMGAFSPGPMWQYPIIRGTEHGPNIGHRIQGLQNRTPPVAETPMSRFANSGLHLFYKRPSLSRCCKLLVAATHAAVSTNWRSFL